MASSIDLKLLSCKDIRCFNFFQKLSVYALASLGLADSEAKDRRSQLQKTPVHRNGGNNPEWNHPIRLDLDKIPDADLKSLFLEIDLLCGGIFGDKLIGEVRVPLTDLLDGSNGAVRFVSYQAKATDGKPNGILNLSYQVNLKGGKIASYPTVEIDSPTAIYYLAPPPPPARYPPPPLQVAYFPSPPPPPPPPLLGYSQHPDQYGFRPEGPYPYAPPPYEYPSVPHPGPFDGDAWQRERGFAGYFNGR